MHTLWRVVLATTLVPLQGLLSLSPFHRAGIPVAQAEFRRLRVLRLRVQFRTIVPATLISASSTARRPAHQQTFWLCLGVFGTL
jgi:hypothetical protein